MAKTETNDAKREDMKALVGRCIRLGWTPATLAGFFGYSSFSAFANGKSMGTNCLRRDLINLPSFADSRHNVGLRIVELGRMVAESAAKLAKEQAVVVDTEAEYLAGPNGEYARKYPETCNYAKHVAQFNGNKWAIEHAQRALDGRTKWLKALLKAVK